MPAAVDAMSIRKLELARQTGVHPGEVLQLTDCGGDSMEGRMSAVTVRGGAASSACGCGYTRQPQNAALEVVDLPPFAASASEVVGVRARQWTSGQAGLLLVPDMGK